MNRMKNILFVLFVVLLVACGTSSSSATNSLANKTYDELAVSGEMDKAYLYDLVVDMTPGASKNIKLADFLKNNSDALYNEHVKMVDVADYEDYFGYFYKITSQVKNYDVNKVPANLQGAWKEVVNYADYLEKTWNEIVVSNDISPLIQKYVDEYESHSNAALNAIESAENNTTDISLKSKVSTDSVEFVVDKVDLSDTVGYQKADAGMTFADIFCTIKNLENEKVWTQETWKDMKIIYADKYEYKVNQLLFYPSEGTSTIAPLQTVEINWYVQVPDEVVASSESLVLQFTPRGSNDTYRIKIQ